MKLTAIEGQLKVIDVPELTLDETSKVIEDIISKGTDDSFYICDLGDVIDKYNTWQRKLPRVTPFYAVKCNTHPAVLDVLNKLGAGFDCASKGELSRILKLGVAPDRIIFANPCKQASHLRYAAAQNITLTTFDNEAELYKCRELMPEASLVLRIRVDAGDAQCPLGMKFGCDVGDAAHLLKVARSLHLSVTGVSFHVGSGCREPAVFYRAIRAASRVFNQAQDYGYSLEVLDIGGGFPGGRGDAQLMDDIADVINMALDEFFPEGESSVRVMAEPGRYFVASAFTLATQVTSRRMATPDHSVMYYINDGVYGAFNCVLYDHQVCRPRPLTTSDGPAQDSSVWGPTCDALDQICASVPLPALSPRDWLVWGDMGAYTLAAAGNFNGFPTATVHLAVTAATRAKNLHIFSSPVPGAAPGPARCAVSAEPAPSAAVQTLFTEWLA